MPVVLGIYDLLGREVTELFSGDLPTGEHSYRWNAGSASSGVYFCRIRAGQYSKTIIINLAK
jgi:hypothetical protein